MIVNRWQKTFVCNGDLIDGGSYSKECLLTINYLFSEFEKLKNQENKKISEKGIEQQNPIIYIAGNHEDTYFDSATRTKNGTVNIIKKMRYNTRYNKKGLKFTANFLLKNGCVIQHGYLLHKVIDMGVEGFN